jgi:hypothetical protein
MPGGEFGGERAASIIEENDETSLHYNLMRACLGFIAEI